jgi:hypothetical protein
MKLSSKSQWADASLRDLKLGGCRIHVAPPSPPSNVEACDILTDKSQAHFKSFRF